MLKIPEKQLNLQKSDGKTRSFLIRRSRPEETEEILALQDIVFGAIPDKAIFIGTTSEEIGESIDDDVCLSVYSGDKLCAFTLMVTNRITPRNLGIHLDYSPEQLKSTVTYDTTFVTPLCRGFGLQRLLFKEKDKLSLMLGASCALATVSPENGASLKNARAAGFEIVGEKLLYSGVNRYIMRKGL